MDLTVKLVDDVAQTCVRIVDVVQLYHHVSFEVLQPASERRHQQVLLGREVVVERADRHTRPPGDFAKFHLLVSVGRSR